LLGDLLMGGMGGKRGKRRDSSMLGGLGISKAQVGVGLLGVAFAAFEHYKQGQQNAAPTAAPPPPMPQPLSAAGAAVAMPPPPPPPMAPMQPAPMAAAAVPAQSDLMLVLEVMIAAAHADGQLDPQERATILQKAMQMELSSNERHQLMRALDAPPSRTELAQRARPEIAADLYAAAILAIRVDTDSERQWLDEWGQALALPEADRRQLEAQFAEVV
jgi:uncharacterized membrane protein YebE (DUF533 family)